ncbi:uncharacterized protein LOC130688145 [Daphnia carinata]|uniref:uncharacterized protein LOC130688145 n=1 Tax=Daphnia carinata TaxID=120202 RepID=UPI00257C7151|nr:uncharacterized protein LOC130688145 [Daphnia carinata]
MATSYDGKVPLGQGGYGSVFPGTFEGREVAVKRVEVYRLGNNNEEEILKQLNHPNIVKLFHCEVDANFKYFYLERCAASLDQVFLHPDDPKKYKGPKLPYHYRIFSQLASGLEHIHSKNVTHRDIKPENVLIFVDSTDQCDEPIIKWADFGLSKPVNERGTYTLSGVRGTRNWYAPELLKCPHNAQAQAAEGHRGTIKSDVFALGLVFGYLLLNGQHPYGGSEDEIRKNLMKTKTIKFKGIYHLHYAYDLMKKMLDHEPINRITSSDVVKQLALKKYKIDGQEKEFFKLCANENVASNLNEKLDDFIRKGINVNANDKHGCNALHILCENNSKENLTAAMKLLIQRGIDINAKNDCGNNALHVLCEFNSSEHLLDAIKCLIQHGINANDKNAFDENALHILCRHNSNVNLYNAIKLLVDSGIDANDKDDDGQNALHLICKNNSSENLLETTELLIQLGVDVNAQDADEWNALHYLCKHNSSEKLMETIELVIQHGIDKAPGGIDALSLLRDNDSQQNVDDIINYFRTTVPLAPNEINMDQI